MSQPRFNLGQMVATPSALAALGVVGYSPLQLLSRHVTGDWGDLGTADKKANDEACSHEGDWERMERILSRYNLPNGQAVYVITEWNRVTTTILLVEEY